MKKWCPKQYVLIYYVLSLESDERWKIWLFHWKIVFLFSLGFEKNTPNYFDFHVMIFNQNFWHKQIPLMIDRNSLCPALKKNVTKLKMFLPAEILVSSKD